MNKIILLEQSTGHERFCETIETILQVWRVQQLNINQKSAQITEFAHIGKSRFFATLRQWHLPQILHFPMRVYDVCPQRMFCQSLPKHSFGYQK